MPGNNQLIVIIEQREANGLLSALKLEYPSLENATANVLAMDLIDAIQHKNVRYLPEIDQAAAYLEDELGEGDMLLIFTAGDAIEINERVEPVVEGF